MKSKIAGWDKVFQFTLIQNIKSKNFIVSTIILAVICFGMIPFAAKGTGSTFSDDILTLELTKLYCYDETGLLGDDIKTSIIEAANKNEIKTKIDDMEVAKLDGKYADADEVKEEFANKEDCDESVLLISTVSDEGYQVEVVRSENSDIGEVNLSMLEECLSTSLYSSLYTAAGITDEQISFISSSNDIQSMTVVDGKVNADEKDGQDEDLEDNFMSGTSSGMVVLMSILMILAIGGELASTSMITEKESKAIEYVLTSIKPLALIVGKVLACIAGQLIQLAVLITSGVISTYIFTHGNTKMTTTTQMAQSLGVTSMVDNFSAVRLVLALLVIVGGIVFYLTLACLIGSTASKMEELTHTNMIYSFVLVIGAYVAMILTMNNFGASSFIQKFVLVFPLSSPFTTPAFVMAGDCSITIAAISLVVMLISIVLLMMLVAKVFEAVILYNGSKVTFKKMMEFAGFTGKTKKRGEGDE